MDRLCCVCFNNNILTPRWFFICHIVKNVICSSVAELQEAKSKVEAEKMAAEEDKATQLLLNKAEVSSLSAH